MMSIMVILKNIVKDENTIRCNYFHEDEAEAFEMVLDYHTGTVLKATDPSLGGYNSHAKQKLLRLAKMDNPPSSAYEIWY